MDKAPVNPVVLRIERERTQLAPNSLTQAPNVVDMQSVGVGLDGVADYTSLINTTIANAERRTTLVFPANRTYRVSSQLIVSAKTYLCISGYGATLALDAGAAYGFRLAGALNYLRIEGFTISGDGVTDSCGIGTPTVNSDASGSVIDLIDITVANTQRGIVLDVSGQARWSRVRTERAYCHDIRGSTSGHGYGIAYSGVDDSMIIACHTADTGRHGIYVSASNRIDIGASLVERNRASATTTAANFVQPAANANVTVQVVSTSWMVAGEQLYIGPTSRGAGANGGGLYVIAAVVDATHVTVTNTNDGSMPANANAGTTINSGARAAIPGGQYGGFEIARSAGVEVRHSRSDGCWWGGMSIEPHESDVNAQTAGFLVEDHVFTNARDVDLFVGGGGPATSSRLRNVEVRGCQFIRTSSTVDGIGSAANPNDSMRIYHGTNIAVHHNDFDAERGFSVGYSPVVLGTAASIADTYLDRVQIHHNTGAVTRSAGVTCAFIVVNNDTCATASDIRIEDNAVTSVSGPVVFNTTRTSTSVVCERNGPRMTALTYGATVDIYPARSGETLTLTVTDGNNMTVNAPEVAHVGARLVLVVKNSSGGAGGVWTWNAAFHFDQNWANPANGKERSAELVFNGSTWRSVGTFSLDIA